ncbi:MAG TPA: SDR family oxidoreductase [Chitinophagaceae bacterium]|nr:SDR family oxidoreductase [Chitinophagaceae bacterium]
MSTFYKNKIVVVTGGSDGIGKEMVKMLIQAGAKVSTCGRNSDKLYQLQTEYPSAPLHTMIADVSNENDCRRLMEMTVKMFGGIDILINNAGISMRAEIKDATVELIKKVMDINFFGVVYCTKFALPHILERKGIIVGISSIAGYRGLPGRSGYSASKFAMQGWLEAIKVELKDSGVHVMWICPGFTTSNIRNSALTEDGKEQGSSPMNEGTMMSTAACSKKILAAVENRKRTVIMTFTGLKAVFMNKFFPKLTDKFIHKFYYKEGKLIK